SREIRVLRPVARFWPASLSLANHPLTIKPQARREQEQRRNAAPTFPLWNAASLVSLNPGSLAVTEYLVVAPRAYWKGYLKLSLVSCPIALFPATTEREKISFHQINKETGNRIRYKKVDSDTGDEVPNDAIVKGYEVAKGEYIELEPEEIDAVAIDSKRIIDI